MFKAWTDPVRLAQWWGPHGFTNPVCQVDVRRGGRIRIDMRGPDGTVYPMTGVYQQVAAPERLAFSSSALDQEGRPLFEVLNTVTFEDQDGQTKLTVQARVVKTTADGAKHLAGVEAGWTQSLERLAEHVAPGSASPADREIVLTHDFDAPRARVWQAWTDPKQVPHWWGPTGFTTTTRTMEVKPGGVWRFVMHGPDGRDYENLITYLEIAEPERLVYKHGGDKDCEPVNFRVTVSFEQVVGAPTRSKVTMRMTFPSKNARDFVVREYNAIEGGKQTLARLGEYLKETGAGRPPAAGSAERPFAITRVFHAPRDRVFELWTQRQHLMRWFGPKGTTISSCTMDARPAGVFHYAMQTPEGKIMWGKWVFRAITAPERLEFIVSFSDEHAGVTRHPLSPDWPLEMLSTVTFAEHAGKGGGTVVSVRWTPLNATATERKTFAEGHDSMQQGWSGTLDRLADYLVKT